MDPTVILTNRYELEQIVDVYRKFDKKEDGILKVFIQTKFSKPPAEGTPALSDV